MRLFYVVTKPLVALFNGMGNLLLRPFGVPPATEAGHAPHSEDELRTLLRESQRGGLIDPHERTFAENVLSFGDRRAREIMRPRPEVKWVSTEEDVRGAARRAMEVGHTRLPVCEPAGGLDTPVGVLHAMDLMRAAFEDHDVALRTLARPLMRVSDATLIDELLRELQRERRHVALVVDEHGTMVGLVTLEDAIEEIVGEIEDEFDAHAPELVHRDGDAIVVHGSASVRLVEDAVGVRIGDPHEATIGGHVLELLGHLPDLGDVLHIDGQRAEVTGVGEARVTELRFEAGERRGTPSSSPPAPPGARQAGEA